MIYSHLLMKLLFYINNMISVFNCIGTVNYYELDRYRWNVLGLSEVRKRGVNC